MNPKYLRYDDTELDEVSLARVKKEIREEEGAMERGQEKLKKKLLSKSENILKFCAALNIPLYQTFLE